MPYYPPLNQDSSLHPAALDLASPGALRASFAAWSRVGTGVWLRLSGLPIDDPRHHGALCNALERLGFGASVTAPLPHAAVLDWTGAGDCSAEGLALFGVATARLLNAGVRVIVVEPDLSDVREVLAKSEIYNGWESLERVAGEVSRRSVLRCCARAALFAGEANESIDNFLDGLAEALRALQAPRPAVQALMGTTVELIHNVLSHASSSHAAATALILPRRRPPVLQIGISDDGVGIPGAVLRQPRHGLLDWFSDATVTRAVIRDHLSGRVHEDTETPQGGGGMARVVKRLLEETTSEVTLRSGSALLKLRSEAPDEYRVNRLTYGTGTQVRIELRLT